MDIVLKGVKVHNLKNVDLALKPNQLIVFTGVSGSGKSSLAFDTIYVEGQRRYVESLSTYARRQLGEMAKPEAESISGISPTIAIEQKTAGKNPRSTVGTMTGIYDFMRVLYARIGTPHCPVSGEPVAPQSTLQILHKIQRHFQGQKIILLSPYAKGKKGAFKDDFLELQRKGYTRIRLDGKIVELSDEIDIDKNVSHDIDLIIDRLGADEVSRLSEGVVGALEQGKGVMSVLSTESDEEELYSQHAFSPKSGLSYGPLDPHDFSFNHPLGMCPTCQGLGRIQEFRLDLIIAEDLSIAEDCCLVASSYKTVRYGNIFDNLAKLYDFKIDTPWKKLSEKAKHVFLYGTEKKWTKMRFVHPVKRSSWTEFVQWRGVLAEARYRYEQSTSDVYKNKMHELMEDTLCPACCGARIRPYPAATLVGKRKIAELTAMSIRDCLLFFQKLKLDEEQATIADQLLKELMRRLTFLNNVGIHYLNLDRTAPTLSGGEAQRVRLASQIGSGLVGTTYILDEPSIGLHPRDNIKLLETLKALRDKGNTVIVVEHDEETIQAADTVVDVGPLAGQNGGEIIANGSLEDLLKSPKSLTGAYLSHTLTIPIPKKRRKPHHTKLVIEKACHHNLKQVTVKIPLGVFIAVTGVSGSGKSSLISDTLYPALSNQLMGSKLPVGKHKKIVGLEEIDKVIAIDQAPIGRTPRSNPSTYIKLFDEIRDLFAMLPESVAAGYKSGRFSFNVREGSCPHCLGMGMIEIDMDFMADEWVQCQHCKGRRFDEKTLQIKFRGKNIYEVLEMTVLEASQFFSALPKIKEKLDVLLNVGLDYIRIGQPSPTLSGGEAQRIKLAKELSRPATGKTFYILDEPTTGLHFHDINKLIAVLQTLVERGNTVLVIEHNMDLVKTADWIIDLGPEAGDEGGNIVGEGTPEMIAKMETATALAMAHALKPKKLKPEKRKKTAVQPISDIVVEGAAQNNLKMVNATIPRGKITLCTGPSGSGKSSFAFETVYAEGQRRYIEAMSLYARRLIQQMPKPKVENIEGLSASIAIEQKNHAGNPRSTLGTITEAYDYLRLLYAHLGTPYSPETGEKIQTISKEFILKKLLDLPPGTAMRILSPIPLKKSEPFDLLKERLQKEGFLRIRLNRDYFELDGEIPFDRQKKNELFLVIDRLILKEGVEKRLFEAIDQAAALSGGTLIAALDKEDLFFNLSFADPTTGKSYPPVTPHSFSFNTQQGMCLECTGLGFQYGANLAEDRTLMALTPFKCVSLIWKENISKQALVIFMELMEQEGIDPKQPLNALTSTQLQTFLGGAKEEIYLKKFGLKIRWIGINTALAKIAKIAPSALKESLIPLLHEIPCPSCQGTRLNPLARNVRIEQLSIADLCALSIDKASAFLETLPTQNHPFLAEILQQLDKRLHFLKAIGLGYLSLDRSAPTLSGGEMQRTHLARQLGGGLTGCLYVLDEPTIGLHPHNNALLNKALRALCEMGNTLLLVEHDPMTVAIADYILDFGPKAGKEGGQISARGTLEQIKKDPNSLTGAYLSGRKRVPFPNKRRTSKEHLIIENATLHNLKNITVSFPINTFSCITGVSGSGKSTLMNDLLFLAIKQGFKKEVVLPNGRILGLDHFDKALKLDQNPIGQTNRADVSTYADLLTPLRTLFASLPLAKTKGLQPKHFSFNHKKGMCKICQGLGTRTILLQFLPPVNVVCETCQGFRLNPISLEVKLKDKHLGNLLEMTVAEAREWIVPIPKVIRILDTLIAVGLGYLKLSQEIATLSGGEAQRLRLSRELSKRSTGKTLYLFDEPTVGLHSEDILKLLEIFHTLVKQGNTLLIIEHNLDVIANADFIADLGPDAGEKGGELVASGTPEAVAAHPTSYTGKYLKF